MATPKTGRGRGGGAHLANRAFSNKSHSRQETKPSQSSTPINQISLPPFHSLLDSSQKVDSNLVSSTAFIPSYGEFNNDWQDRFSAMSYSTSIGGNFNGTEEFFFTAQQMAAHLFDQYQQHNSNYQPNNLSDCSFYQPQQPTTFETDSNPYANSAFQPPSTPLYQQWSENPRSASHSSNSNGSQSDGDAASFSQGPEQFKPLSDRETVLMLPPPVNYRRRNERERERVRCVNDGYSRLREIIPSLSSRNKRISKVETLRAASRYIRSLHEALGMARNNHK